MVGSVKEYLNLTVLQEAKPVTYRALSRRFKLHYQDAIQTIEEFYASQNAKKADSVHATYVVVGIIDRQQAAILTQDPDLPPKKEEGGTVEQNGDAPTTNGDETMRSSPPASSAPKSPSQRRRTAAEMYAEYGEDIELLGDEPRILDKDDEPVPNCIRVVPEEELKTVKATFVKICGEPVMYSIEPSSFQNLEILSHVNQEAARATEREDALDTYPKMGLLSYPGVHREFAFKPPPAQSQSNTAQAGRPTLVSGLKRQDTAGSTRSDTSTDPKTASRPSAKLPLKRDSSSFFGSQSAAKKPKSTIVKTEPKSIAADTPKAATRSGAHGGSLADTDMDSRATVQQATDAAMEEVSDADEGDTAPVEMNKGRSSANDAAVVARKQEREAKKQRLQAMMDDSDEEMEDAPPVETAGEEVAEDSPQAEPEQPEQPEAGPEKPTVTTSGGRRRGRRQVMKKRQYKDEDGYMTTKTEAVWESFSEDEPPPPVSKLDKTHSQPPLQSSQKMKTKVAGGPSGKINSFFSRK